VSPANQTLLARFAVAISVFALILVGVVAAQGSDDGGGGGGSAAAAPVTVALSEFAISPADIMVPAGGSIEVTNNGTIPHNLAITDTELITSDLDAGASETLDLSSLEPGTYEVFCAIPGHKDSGMVGSLTITEDGAATGGSGDTAAADGGSHAAVDLNTIDPNSEQAAKLDEDMRLSMDEGIKTFLNYQTVKYPNGEVEKGNRKLEPEILEDGTKKFVLEAKIIDWEVSPGKIVKAWTYNEQVPGPWIRVEPGDKVQVEIKNSLPISTDIHFHGVDVPNSQDGVGGLTQDYILPGETYLYEFTTTDHPQLAMYHAHYHGQEAVLNGMFAIFQVGDVELPEAGSYGPTFDIPEGFSMDDVSQEIPMVLNDAGTIGLSLNGKAFPATEAITANSGEYVMIHFYNEGLVGHPMHLHSQPQLVIAKDGFPVPPYQMDTLWVSPGERYTVLVRANRAGVWAFHCHILNHAESNEGLIGMVTAMVVNDPTAKE
jgi:plastocyanin